jgi:conjugative transfer signal peptidase TraF
MTEARAALVAAAAAAICLAIAATLLWPPRPVLLWNASASSPVGLYSVASPERLRAGDFVVAWAPAGARRLAARRHYLPDSVPLVKRVGAIAGARVCAHGRLISIDGDRAALRHTRDGARRTLPWWSGCARLGRGDLFLLSPGMPEAFDGRYFGITRANSVIGKARLLWER